MRAMLEMVWILFEYKVSPHTLKYEVGRFVEWGRMVRSGSVLDISETLTKTEKKDPFITYAFDLLIAGYNPQMLRQMLEDNYEADHIRGEVQSKILYTMGTFSPAFGMVGTLIGLIIMLDNMQGDPSMLGQGLALALITTLYGVLLAQLLFKPAAVKIHQRLEIEMFRKIILTEGFILIAEKKDIITIQDRLNSMLAPKTRYSISKEMESAKVEVGQQA